MTLKLTKSSPAINLTKSLPAMTHFKIGLAWDAKSDLDASAILLDENDNLFEGMPVFYGKLSASGVTHSGDALNGDASGDDETITLALDEVDESVKKCLISITSYSTGEPVMFGSTANPVAKLYDANDNVLIESHLDADAAFGTAVKFVILERTGDGWTYKNLSETVGSSANGLTDILALYR